MLTKTAECDNAAWKKLTGRWIQPRSLINIGYLLPRNARYTVMLDTAISIDRVCQIMNDPKNCKVRTKVLLILDACHSGAQIGKAASTMSKEFMQRVFEQVEGMAVIASCKQGAALACTQLTDHGRAANFQQLLQRILKVARLVSARWLTRPRRVGIALAHHHRLHALAKLGCLADLGCAGQRRVLGDVAKLLQPQPIEIFQLQRARRGQDAVSA